MIIDLILDRYEGGTYDPHEFVENVKLYNAEISKALEIARKEFNNFMFVAILNEYIDRWYNPKIKDFIREADWIYPQRSTDWIENVKII